MLRSSFNKGTPHIDTSSGECVVSEGDVDVKSRLFRASWTRSLNSSNDLCSKSKRSDTLLLSFLNEINDSGTFFLVLKLEAVKLVAWAWAWRRHAPPSVVVLAVIVLVGSLFLLE
ncbi:Uncharacterized protein Fot_14088 [Forsythia ovata]|uniref:Uncharacterized protein n=1 Tax=Forsythia ovata TaxID=205694 RepID=A0ABD1W5U1_9LAMI